MKSMDIRSAFQSLNTRKRKAGETEENEAQVLKRTKENSIDESTIHSNAASNSVQCQQSNNTSTVTSTEQSKKEILVIDLLEDSQSSVISGKISESTCEKTNDFNKENLPNADSCTLKPTITNNEHEAQLMQSQTLSCVDNKVEHSVSEDAENGCKDVELLNSTNANIESSPHVQTTQKRKRRSSDGESDEEKQSTKGSTTIKVSSKASSSIVIKSHSSSPKLVKPIKVTSLKDIEDPNESIGGSDEIDDAALHSPTSPDPVFSTDKDDVDTSKHNSSVDSKTGEDIESDFNSSFGLNSTPSELNASVSSLKDSSVNKSEIESKDMNTSNGESKSQNVTPVRKKRRMSVAEAKLREEKRREKELLAEKKAEEKRLQKEEKELERQRLIKEKQLRKEREEIERKERERLKQEKKEQEEQRKQKEKEEKAKQKQQLVESKAEEKRKKDEEKKLAEEKKSQQQSEKERKHKEAFANFFKKSGFLISQPQTPDAESVTKSVQENEAVFKPFQVTEGMALAPVIPTAAQKRFNKKQLDVEMKNQTSDLLYLDLLKSKTYHGISQEKRKEILDESEVMIITDVQVAESLLKGKLFQFCDNIRPAYWGTWRKKSRKVRPRTPFGQDEILDYEVDSDEEWDEGGPGESLTGTEDEESEDDYEVDNEFFVPHGYLSAEEEGDEDDDDDDENTAPTDPDELKTRLKMKEREFLLERKKKTVELKPIIFGCFFEADESNDITAAERFLLPYAAELLITGDILTARSAPEKDRKNSVKDSIATKQYIPVPDEAMPFLIRLVHGNINNRASLCKEFATFWTEHCRKVRVNDKKPDPIESSPLETEKLETVKSSKQKILTISKRQLWLTIQSMAKYGKHAIGDKARSCWWVEDTFLEKYNLLDIPLPNEWQYITVIASRSMCT